VKRSENCSEEEIQTLKRLKTVHWITERCRTLFEEFAGMLRDKEQTSEEQARRRLEEWTGRAKASGIAELEAFAVKLLQDTDAVVAAVTLTYSQGQTEGRINKLKLVKRSMYGRGKFDLLRQRVLVRIGSLSSQAATRRQLELHSSDSRKNREGGANPSPTLMTCCLSSLC
jgi:transposase